MARSIECKCEHNFTCGYCLRNAKPWFWTLSDGSAIYEIPIQKYRTGEEIDDPSQEHQTGPR